MGNARYPLRHVRKGVLSEGNRVVTHGKCPISAASSIEKLSEGVATGGRVFAQQIHGLRGASDDALLPAVEVNKKSVSDMRKNKRLRRIRFCRPWPPMAT